MIGAVLFAALSVADLVWIAVPVAPPGSTSAVFVQVWSDGRAKIGTAPPAPPPAAPTVAEVSGSKVSGAWCFPSPVSYVTAYASDGSGWYLRSPAMGPGNCLALDAAVIEAHGLTGLAPPR